MFLMLAFSGGLSAAEPKAQECVFRDGEKVWRYEKFLSLGWTVYFEKSLTDDEKLVADLMAELDKSFAHIRKVIPAGPLEFLKTIPVWVSNEPNYPLRKGENGVIPFHRNKGWLRGRGMNPHMVPGVHVINPGAVLYEHKVFEWGPMTILHELSHGYHNFHLKLRHPAVRKAYQNAIEKGLYLKVPDRKDPEKMVKAYAATNHEEYFAEATEAYFGQNDWFPHNRKELEEYDPVGYRMIEEVWQVKAAAKDE